MPSGDTRLGDSGTGDTSAAAGGGARRLRVAVAAGGGGTNVGGGSAVGVTTFCTGTVMPGRTMACRAAKPRGRDGAVATPLPAGRATCSPHRDTPDVRPTARFSTVRRCISLLVALASLTSHVADGCAGAAGPELPTPSTGTAAEAGGGRLPVRSSDVRARAGSADGVAEDEAGVKEDADDDEGDDEIDGASPPGNELPCASSPATVRPAPPATETGARG